MAENSATFFAFYLLVFILTISEITIVEGKLCEKSSKTWSGTCKDTDKCNKQCIEWEGAKNGACHQREAQYMCFCYSDCSSKEKKPPPSSAPPPLGGGQAPPSGGEQPPPEGAQPAPPGGVQPAPPNGGGQQPPPNGGSQPAPPPGCAKIDIDKLIFEALTRYKIEVEKAMHFELPVDPSIILV